MQDSGEEGVVLKTLLSHCFFGWFHVGRCCSWIKQPSKEAIGALNVARPLTHSTGFHFSSFIRDLSFHTQLFQTTVKADNLPLETGGATDEIRWGSVQQHVDHYDLAQRSWSAWAAPLISIRLPFPSGVLGTPFMRLHLHLFRFNMYKTLCKESDMSVFNSKALMAFAQESMPMPTMSISHSSLP